MLPFLTLLSLLQPGSDSVLARIRQVASTLGDTGVVRAAGFGKLAAGRIVDLSPFQGQHWVHRWRLVAKGDGLGTPSFVMFVPVDGAWKPVGLAYTTVVSRDNPVPDDLAGIPARWHLHQPCIVVPGEGAALADGEADCRARGGGPRPPELAMVHAWTVPNPEGPFAHDNVALPYWITGLAQPRAADLATPARARAVRALGLALGESYGAILPYSRLVEHVSSLPGLADSLEAGRAAIRELVPQLKAREKAGDRAGRRTVATRMIDVWERLRRLYALAAPSAAIRTQVERQHARALGDDPGHHMH